MTKAESRIIANRVIFLLKNRGGFDHWWRSHSYPMRILIAEDIAREIRAAHVENCESKQ